jgi:hypothetical protein
MAKDGRGRNEKQLLTAGTATKRHPCAMMVTGSVKEVNGGNNKARKATSINGVLNLTCT